MQNTTCRSPECIVVVAGKLTTGKLTTRKCTSSRGPIESGLGDLQKRGISKVFETRFDQLQSYENTFGFLFDLKKLKLADDDKLKASCANLEVFLKRDTHYDIDGNDLFLELKLIKGSLPKDIKKVVEVLDFFKTDGKLLSQYMDCISHNDDDSRFGCLRGKNFLKLKLIKSYLKSNMSQERLNGLAMMSIERSLAE